MGKDVKKMMRDELRQAAVPVRNEASRLFAPYDARSAARYGISVRKVGTVTVEQRLRKSGNAPARRPNFGSLQMERALLPGLANKGDEAVEHLDDALGRIVTRWGKGF